MRRLMLWIVPAVILGGFWGARPAWAPLVTVVEEPEEEGEEAGVDSETVDFSDVEDAANKPTWSPSFENQD